MMRETDHSFSFHFTEVKNEWIYTTTPTCSFTEYSQTTLPLSVKKFHNFVGSEIFIFVLTKAAETFECSPSNYPNFQL
jgi:hypothetical protein